MKSLDELKEEIRAEASENPEKFFATDVLKEKGFSRSKCENCGLHFWSSDPERKVCGEPECSGGYTFIDSPMTPESYSYIEAWEKFRDFMSSRGYDPIDRYPVVARWRNDVEFVGGSIYNFQPHVVSGEAEPPAEELVVPQPSLRFNDIDNVGVTGRHYVLHTHIGQTCFRDSKEYDQDRYFRDMLEFALEELKIPKDELVLHEDAWGGGGNLGACMEFFVGGLELWNQVYMFYSQTPDGYEELDLKVLDMGMGQERITWISHGTETSYECVMPLVLERMKERTGVEVNEAIWKRFLPYSGLLNVDEVEDIDEKWQEIADKMELDVEKLKEEVKPVAALYSVAEHSRALLFALADGKLPSNTGGGHNLRAIYRRSEDFIDRYGWELDIVEVAEWHAEELKPMFPELEGSMDEVREILEVEEKRYEKAREKARNALEGVEDPSVEDMVQLYESEGVSPEMMEAAGFDVPEDFYSIVAGDEETVEAEEEEFSFDTEEETEKLYYKDENRRKCEAEVVETLPNGWVILDRTVFYPEGGGQAPDHGELRRGDESFSVDDVQKQSGVILHHVPGRELSEGDEVEAVIDWDRRKQLMQHHTATHMVNHAARTELGNHIWQAGARKTVEKGRLDITHYEKPSRTRLDMIEENVRGMISNDFQVTKENLKKSEAEKQYGFRLYQGGAAPGGEVRVVSIDDLDSEACGGTHLEKTSQTGEFVITKAKRIQDGVIRLEFKAGEAAKQHLESIERRIENLADRFDVPVVDDYREVQRELCRALSVEPEHLEDSVDRFVEENEEMSETIIELSGFLERDVSPVQASGERLEDTVKSVFESWKENEKKLESLENSIESHVRSKMADRIYEANVPTENIGLLIQVARKLAREHEASITLIGERGAVSASYHEEFDADENLGEHFDEVQGDETFAKAFN